MSSKYFNDPAGSKLLRIWHELDVPGFVKTAQAIDEQDFDSVPESHYAYPEKKLYPVNNRSNTWISRAIFNTDKPGIEKQAAERIQKKLDEAADYWGITNPEKLNKNPNRVHQVEIKDEGEKTILKVAIDNNYSGVVGAFYGNRKNFTFDQRCSMAQQLLACPDDLKQPIAKEHAEYLQKAAGEDIGLIAKAREVIFSRLPYANERTNAESYEMLVKQAHALDRFAALVPSDELRKTASILDRFDREHGLDSRYGRSLPFPEEALFFLHHKIADCALELTNGSLVAKSDLIEKKASVEEFFDSVIGERPYQSDEEMFDVIATLPRPDADRFQEIVFG